MIPLVPLILVSNDVYWLPYVLDNMSGLFRKYVIYDVGSTDGTQEVVQHFAQNEQNAEVVVEFLPMVEPKAQIAYRNAMIADAKSDYYMLVDGDEVWPAVSMQLLFAQFPDFVKSERPFGIVNRVEVCRDLKSAWDPNEFTPHHRLYHRTAIWRGTHPGEYSEPKQRPSREYTFDELATVYHFHGATRSPMDLTVPRREGRRSKHTYSPGEKRSFNIFADLPELKKPPRGGFKVCPELKGLWNEKEMSDI